MRNWGGDEGKDMVTTFALHIPFFPKWWEVQNRYLSLVLAEKKSLFLRQCLHESIK